MRGLLAGERRARRGSAARTPRFTRTRCAAALAPPAARAAAAAASARYVASQCSSGERLRALRRRRRAMRSRAATAAAGSSFCSRAKSLRGSSSDSRLGLVECRAARPPRPGVGVRELDGPSADRTRLRGNAAARRPTACEQRATIATSRAANATVSAAAEPPPGARPSAESRSRNSSSRSSR